MPSTRASRQPVAEKEPHGQKSVEVLTRAALANIDANRPAHGRVSCSVCRRGFIALCLPTAPTGAPSGIVKNKRTFAQLCDRKARRAALTREGVTCCGNSP